MAGPEMSERKVAVSDNLKQYIENWADEETASEIETNRLKDNLRSRDDQSTETVFMINASELQYLENGIPLVTSENGIPLVASENGQYILKSGVSLDNSMGMVRIVDKTNQVEPTEVVNLHIMDTYKSDCMLASKPNDANQRPNDYASNDKPKVVVHQNTVIKPGQLDSTKEPTQCETGQGKAGGSLPVITEQENRSERICKRETADKNCSPINVEQMEEQIPDLKVKNMPALVAEAKQDSDEIKNESEVKLDEQVIKEEDVVLKIENAENDEPSKGEDIKEEPAKKEEDPPNTEEKQCDEIVEDNGIVCHENETTEGKCTADTQTTVEPSSKIDKPKRSRRIFSVDDIMNNIGTDRNKTNADKELRERRRSLQLTRDFLEQEVNAQITVAKEETLVDVSPQPEEDSLPNAEAEDATEPTVQNDHLEVDQSKAEKKLSMKKIEDDVDPNQVQYRSAIRVEENNVLLQIAGELVEINVATVNGKKVITVVPLSETTVVDFNDNYETLDNTEEQTKIDLEADLEEDLVADVLSLEAPETDISEIIIGSDTSVEEEIQLDLEKPAVLCTKAAKKAYDNDLQIPSITTSEDFNDNNKRDSYNANDKVSSSKEHCHEKTDQSDAKLGEKLKKKSDEEFVRFKDLVKARRLKKVRQTMEKRRQESGADSTNHEESKKTQTEKKTAPEVCKTKENTLKTYRRPSKSENKEDQSIEKSEAANPKTDDLDKVAKAEERRRPYKLEDPRLKARLNGDVIVPSVSELLKENSRMDNKKKLSLEEYNRRKRQLSDNAHRDEVEVTPKKTEKDAGFDATAWAKKPRPKSLDDLKPKESGTKRKLSLAESCSDWEPPQNNRLKDFSGLIDDKSKTAIDVNEFDIKPMTSSSEDEILQTYREQVDSKLSSLNLQIPRTKPPGNVLISFSQPEADNLMERFLRNERITGEEMEKIKKIIAYKRLVLELNKIKSPELNPTYEIRKQCPERDMKLHLKKVPDKKKRRRFRNLYSESTSESEGDLGEAKNAYSVVQSNSYAAGVPKLIIKRKTEAPVPVVRLERLDLGLLVGKKRKIC